MAKSGTHTIRQTLPMPRNPMNGQVDAVLRDLDLLRATIKDLTDELAEHIADPMAAIAEYEVHVEGVGLTQVEVTVSVPLMGRNDD